MGIDNISEVKFEEPNTLVISYGGGSVFSYTSVTQNDFTRLMRSDDVSRAVRKLIRSGNIVGVKR